MKNSTLTKKLTSLFVTVHVIILILFTGNTVLAQPVSQTFTSSGTYTIPAGYTATVTIEAWGAGGGGVIGSAGGGGGGGAYSSTTTTLSAGNYSVVIGTGGTGGLTPGTGGNSSFATTLVIAAGGAGASGVNGGTGGTAAASTGTTKYAGGAGATTPSSASDGGGGGGSATALANGGNGTINAGGNGQGNGGNGGTNTSKNGKNGVSPGGGGGGSFNTGNNVISGNGANGQVIVTVKTFQALPVIFGAISASVKNGIFSLNWSTETEKNSDRFIIELSKDGKTFVAVDSLKTQAKNGLSDTPLQYTYSIEINTFAKMMGWNLQTISFALLALVVIVLFILMVKDNNRQQKTKLLILLVVCISAFTLLACHKQIEQQVSYKNMKVWVRITQVDIDGTRVSSKIVQAVNE